MRTTPVSTSDEELGRFLVERRASIERRMEALSVELVMPAPLSEPVRTALRSPGKRLRGVLTIAAGEACGARSEYLYDAAAAFEMIHTCSLILDDLPSMDDAVMRRGELALHRRYGEDLAILAAVALLNHAYGLLAKSHALATPRRWSAASFLERIVDAVGTDGTIGGEAVDLHCEASSLDFPTLEYIHSRKTGTLFVAAAAAGAMLAGASDGTLRSIEAYAKNLGLAYQITDDVLDVTSTAEILGKDVGKDEAKLTFVKLAGLEGARVLCEELIDTSVRAVEPLGNKARFLTSLALFVRDRAR